MFKKLFASVIGALLALCDRGRGRILHRPGSGPGQRDPGGLGRDLDRAHDRTAVHRRAGAGHERGAAAHGRQRRLAAADVVVTASKKAGITDFYESLTCTVTCGGRRAVHRARSSAMRTTARCGLRLGRAASCGSRSGCRRRRATRLPRTTRRSRSTSTPSRRTDATVRRSRLLAACLRRCALVRFRGTVEHGSPVRVAGGSMYPALRRRRRASSSGATHGPWLGDIALLQRARAWTGAAPGGRDRRRTDAVRTKGDANPIGRLRRSTPKRSCRATVVAWCPSGQLLERWRGASACDTLSAQSNSARR